MSTYCTTEHPNAQNGCYGLTNHEGKHWCYTSQTVDGSITERRGYDQIWRWEDGPVTFTPEELGVLLMLLAPVKQFFPDLQAKVTAAQAATK